MDRDPKVFLIG